MNRETRIERREANREKTEERQSRRGRAHRRRGSCGGEGMTPKMGLRGEEESRAGSGVAGGGR